PGFSHTCSGKSQKHVCAHLIVVQRYRTVRLVKIEARSREPTTTPQIAKKIEEKDRLGKSRDNVGSCPPINENSPFTSTLAHDCEFYTCGSVRLVIQLPWVKIHVPLLFSTYVSVWYVGVIPGRNFHYACAWSTDCRRF